MATRRDRRRPRPFTARLVTRRDQVTCGSTVSGTGTIATSGCRGIGRGRRVRMLDGYRGAATTITGGTLIDGVIGGKRPYKCRRSSATAAAVLRYEASRRRGL